MITHTNHKSPVKVSVVMPIHNQAHHLTAAMANLLNQSMPDYELIIVNDGSTDQTAAILAGLQHPKVRVITQEQQGLARALNAGFRMACGEYLTWTLASNLVKPSWLQEMAAALDQSAEDVGFAMSSFAVIDRADQVLEVNNNLRFDMATLLTSYSGNPSFMYRASLAAEVGAYDITLEHGADLDMWLRMAEVSRAVPVESVLYFVRQETIDTDKLKLATVAAVNRYLARNNNEFNIDRIFPSIALSADPIFERWKARVRLVSMAASSKFYCPVDAVNNQLINAIAEKYDNTLVANIAHLLLRHERWADAAYVIEHYQRNDHSDFLSRMADMIARKAVIELQNIPFATLDESHLASDCRGALSQQQLIRHLAPQMAALGNKLALFEQIVMAWANLLSDQNDHPEVWNHIAEMRTIDENKMLQHMQLYLHDLANAPQEPFALVLIQILEAMCLAYTNQVAKAKQQLEMLMQDFPVLQVAKGALDHVNKYAEVMV